MEKQLKEIIRSVVREQFISELSKNDVHVKEIMKFYDKGTYSTKKAVSIFVSGKPNATRNQILDDLGDMGYDDAWEVMDHFKLTLESVTEGDIVPDASVNEKSDDVFADYISSKGKTKGRSSRVDRVAKYGNYKFEFDDRDGTVRLLYNGKLISYGYPDWSTGGFIMIHSSWKNNDKPFNSLEDIIKYFKSKRITTEADVVPGGLAKGLSLNDIAEKHGVSVDIMVAEFKKGIAVEMEHTTDREVAKEITLDHLFEDPKYYDKLAKVEEYVDDKGVEHVGAALPQTEEEPIEEAFKHIIHVDTPTQVVSKPIAAQILALAKKGVRSKEIGLEMGFTGNAKLAADAFQKVKNQIYFSLDKKNESTNPSDIIKDLDTIKNDLIKKADVLIAKKKKLYANVDIESPMSADEKKLNKDIADLFSQIQQLILQKRKIK